MLFLERVGIQTDIKETHQFTTEERRIGSGEFFERATVMLDELSGSVLENILPNLENFSARWNPMGFMVFPLGSHPELGILRLHVWPRNLRKLTPKGEPIHNHAWHLASRILTGVYSDDVYTVTEHKPDPIDESQRRQRGLLRVFSVGYGNTGGILETDGSCMRVELKEHRIVEANQHHFIEEGVFHNTTIAHDKLVATLVFDAPTLASIRSKILIDGPTDPITEVREVITSQDITTVKNQLG